MLDKREKEKMSICIYVATQKEIHYLLANCYLPIFVGASISDKNKYGYITDDTGENISNKNKSFCELTALYWMWKNSSSEIVGLCHYRRYLTEKHFSCNAKNALNEKRIEELLHSYDLILPHRSCLWGTVEKQYSNGQYGKDFEICRSIVGELYPEYIPDFEFVAKSDSIYICNMFIGKKEIIDQYCKWLFSILFELEKRIDISNYSNSEKRIFGYLSERLFNVWLKHNNFAVCEKRLLNTDLTLMMVLRNIFHSFNYKILKIDVMKHSNKRRIKRMEKNNE